MTTKTTLLLLVALTLVLILIGNLALPAGAGPVVSHWNAQGQPDGYSSRAVAVYLLPLMLLGTGLLVLFIPAIDPLRGNVAGFRGALNGFVLVFAGFLAYLYLLTLAYNRGLVFSMNQAMMPGMAAILWAIAGLLARARRNWFIGIRTPWTLSNDQVWDETHRAGARAFRVVALVSLLGMLFPGAAVFFLMIPLLAATVGVLVYSYVVYRRVEARAARRP